MIENKLLVLKGHLYNALDNLDYAIDELKKCDTYALNQNIETCVWYKVKTNVSGDEIKTLEAKLKDFIEIFETMRNSIDNYSEKLG